VLPVVETLICHPFTGKTSLPTMDNKLSAAGTKLGLRKWDVGDLTQREGGGEESYKNNNLLSTVVLFIHLTHSIQLHTVYCSKFPSGPVTYEERGRNEH